VLPFEEAALMTMMKSTIAPILARRSLGSESFVGGW
jgi:hypothetical protein